MDIKQRNEEIRRGMGVALLIIILVAFLKAVPDGDYDNPYPTGNEIRIDLGK
jgi:nitrogen fixation-related uncharacterized protein